MWQHQLANAWRQGKRTIGHMYSHALKFAGDLDRGFSVGKRVLASLDPLLQDIGAGEVSRVAVRGIQGYEQGREQASGMHNAVQANLTRLRRNVPELGLD